MLFLLKLLKLLEENFCELGVEDVEEEEEEDVEEGEFVSPLLLISMSFCSVWNGYLGVGGLVQYGCIKMKRRTSVGFQFSSQEIPLLGLQILCCLYKIYTINGCCGSTCATNGLYNNTFVPRSYTRVTSFLFKS